MAIDSSKEPEQMSKPDRVAKIIIRMRLGQVPSMEDLSGLSADELTEVSRESTRIMYANPLQDKSDSPRLTPEVISKLLSDSAPLHEAEAVLISWLETVGGIVYGFPKFTDPTARGWVVLNYRKESQGAYIKTAPPYFDTMSQMLSFALKWAEETIRLNEHGKTYGQTINDFSDRLAAVGVDPDLILTVLAQWTIEKGDQVHNAE